MNLNKSIVAKLDISLTLVKKKGFILTSMKIVKGINMSDIKMEAYYKCKSCGDEIFWNTQKKMISCTCEKISVDGCEYYIRLIGDSEDFERIVK